MTRENLRKQGSYSEHIVKDNYAFYLLTALGYDPGLFCLNIDSDGREWYYLPMMCFINVIKCALNL